MFLLLFHLAHVFEEVWGQFRAIEILGGLGWFLMINWLLFGLVLGIFYFILAGKHRAYYLGIAYALIMVLNGIGHNIAMIVTGDYFGGYAGGFSGIGLILVGGALAYYLRKELCHGRESD
jgi:hypothetical protein